MLPNAAARAIGRLTTKAISGCTRPLWSLRKFLNQFFGECPRHRESSGGSRRRRESLLDVQGEPTVHQGADEDVAVSPRGTCWVKKAGAWRYEDELGDVCERLVKTDSLIVLGNLSLPIVDGKHSRSTTPSEPLRSSATSRSSRSTADPQKSSPHPLTLTQRLRVKV